MSKPLFFIMGNKLEESDSVVNDINNAMATAKTFKKAYEMALFLSDIRNPDLSYRRALNKYKEDECVKIREKDTSEADGWMAMITRINLY